MQSVSSTNTNNNKENLELLKQRYAQRLELATRRKQDNDVQSMKDCMELAEILEELFCQSGQEAFIGTISSRICRDYRDRGVVQWKHIADYLPAKYKREYDDSTGRYSDSANILDNNVSVLKGLDLKEIPVDIKQMAFDGVLDFINRIEQDAREEGYALLKHHDDYSTDKSEKKPVRTILPAPEETPFSDAIQQLIDSLIELKKDAIKFPPISQYEAKLFSAGIVQFSRIIKWMTDSKYSMHTLEWLNKENYRQCHGNHAAAVHEKCRTVLCESCSKNLDDEPDEYEIMYADYRSPTGWRCLHCKGTEGIMRAMTREQLGDKSVYIQQYAQDLMQRLPALVSLFQWYDLRVKPHNGARKVRLSGPLSKLA